MLGEMFVFLHIVFMFAGVAAADGMGFLVFRIAGTRDVAAIRTTYRLMRPITVAVVPLFFIGLIFGVISIFAIGFDPFEPWLLIAYALFVIQVLLGSLFVDRWHGRVGAAVMAEDADPNSGELQAALNDRTGQRVALLQSALVILFIFDMVVKPFSNRVL